MILFSKNKNHMARQCQAAFGVRNMLPKNAYLNVEYSETFLVENVVIILWEEEEIHLFKLTEEVHPVQTIF